MTSEQLQANNPPVPPTPLPLSWIKSLFQRLGLSYGAQFADKWAGQNLEAVMQHWATTLAGYTNAEMVRGYQALSTCKFPPSLPEFQALCRPPVDATAAYYEAVAGVQARFSGELGKWSHPAIFYAAAPMASELSSQTYASLKTRWEAALNEQLAKGHWEEIKKPRLSLPAPEKRADKAAVTKTLQAIGAGGIGSNINDTFWYRQILAREAKGDTSLKPMQLRMAHEAAKTHGYKHTS